MYITILTKIFIIFKKKKKKKQKYNYLFHIIEKGVKTHKMFYQMQILQ